ncbi:pirin family protein [Aquimarina brevivitae]|uniref:Pirin n=1 Tax=Aquimarina brevivitae TaxID=323412 RepID=A0A4Q7P146_9FLAO|nr:pirin family protein [Aquimarina brevivitae]RZS93414.1 hypothetical protein EV197_1992 [Aquimarina brevivitae]
MSAIQKIVALGFPWQTSDPFLFCAYHEDQYPKGNSNMGPDADFSGRLLGQDFDPHHSWRMYHGKEVPGFPAHPHLGFETVTIVEQGLVDHSDSLGAAARFGNGDVQWITTGKGLQHSEMFPLLNEKEENPLLLFQIWLNLPRASKNVPPYFQMLWQEDIPVVTLTDKHMHNVSLKLICGAYKEHQGAQPNPDSWAADPANGVAIWLIKLEPNAEFELPEADETVNRSLYYFKGKEIQADGYHIPVKHEIRLDPSKSITLHNGTETSCFLFLQGKPINEPVIQQGPFVTNSVGEIKEAMLRYHKDQFGGWPWPKHDNVHQRNKGRFAILPNGSEIIK